MKKIYFLCTGNSCRSQMAEGYAKKILPANEFQIKSAGIETHGLNLNYLNTSDLVITLCGDAKDKCPMLPPQTKTLHWPLSDPAQATGTLEEQLQEFRKVRDEIKKLVTSLNNYVH